MKACNRCGDLKSDEEFAVDRTREDGLAIICRPCNKEKCKEWYQQNKRRKIEATQLYKQQHPEKSADPPRQERLARQAEKQKQQESDAPGDVQIVRFSASEWEFCTEQGAALGLRPGEYVRLLVRDERARQRRASESDPILEDGNQENEKSQTVRWPNDPVVE